MCLNFQHISQSAFYCLHPSNCVNQRCPRIQSQALCEFYGSAGAEALENQNNPATQKVLLFGAHKNLQLAESSIQKTRMLPRGMLWPAAALLRSWISRDLSWLATSWMNIKSKNPAHAKPNQQKWSPRAIDAVGAWVDWEEEELINWQRGMRKLANNSNLCRLLSLCLRHLFLSLVAKVHSFLNQAMHRMWQFGCVYVLQYINFRISYIVAADVLRQHLLIAPRNCHTLFTIYQVTFFYLHQVYNIKSWRNLWVRILNLELCQFVTQ